MIPVTKEMYGFPASVIIGTMPEGNYNSRMDENSCIGTLLDRKTVNQVLFYF